MTLKTRELIAKIAVACLATAPLLAEAAGQPRECRTQTNRFLVAGTIRLTTDALIKNDPGQCTLLDAFQIANDGANLGTNKCGSIKLVDEPYNGLVDIDAGNRTFLVANEIFLGKNVARLKNAKIEGLGNTRFFRVATDNAHLVFYNVSFEGGWGQDGGAILVESGANVTVFNSSFTGNTAVGNGGAIAHYGYGTLFLHEVVLTDNGAEEGKGGALFISGSEDSSIWHSRMTKNFAGTGGGALAIENSAVNVSASYVEENGTVTGDGGGIHSAGSLQVDCSSVFGNHADNGDGGGIYVQPASGYLSLLSSRVEANEAGKDGAGRGGAVFVGDDFTSQHSSISFNSAHGDGGALYIDDAAADDEILIENTTISHNTSQGGSGGGLWITGAKAQAYPDVESPFGMQHSFEILNTIIDDNVAADAQIAIDDAGVQSYMEILFVNNVVSVADSPTTGCSGLVQRLRTRRYNDPEAGSIYNVEWPDNSCGPGFETALGGGATKTAWAHNQTYTPTIVPRPGDTVVCNELKNLDQFQRAAPCRLGSVRSGSVPPTFYPYAPL